MLNAQRSAGHQTTGSLLSKMQNHVSRGALACLKQNLKKQQVWEVEEMFGKERFRSIIHVMNKQQ
jgi:hypothetical protein